MQTKLNRLRPYAAKYIFGIAVFSSFHRYPQLLDILRVFLILYSLGLGLDVMGWFWNICFYSSVQAGCTDGYTESHLTTYPVFVIFLRYYSRRTNWNAQFFQSQNCFNQISKS